jgi:hypothetical protein
MKALRLLFVILLLTPVAAHAAPVTYSGFLDDPTSLSPASGVLDDYLLTGTPDLTTFPDQNVALFEFTVASASTYTVTSKGYNDVYGNTPNVDGFDAYVAIFQGSGPAAAFTAEFFNAVQPGDFQATTPVLAAGTYTLAITVWFNAACGAGWCAPVAGTLGDAFSGLSNPDLSRQLYFEVDLDATAVVPEPATTTLLVLGGALLRLRHRRFRK